MSSTVLFPVAVFVTVLAGYFLISSLAGRQSAMNRRRLEHHEVQLALAEAKRLDRVNVLKEQNYSSLRLLNAILRKFKPAQTAAGELLRANLRLTVPQYLLLRFLIAAILYIAARTASGFPTYSLAAFPIALMIPRVVLVVLGRRRRTAFEAQLAETIDLLVGALRAGYGFLQAIEAATRDVENPMREEFVRVIEQVNAGTPPQSALSELPRRIASYDLGLFVTAVTVQRTVGGNLAEVLENIAATVRERRRIRAEVRAITTGPRVSSYVLGLFPLGLMVYFAGTDAGYRHLMLSETIGRMMLGFAAVWSLIGLVLSTAVSKVEY